MQQSGSIEVLAAGVSTVIRPALLFLAFALPISAAAQHAHEHGLARLDVAVEKGRLSISLDSPLDNLVGFEHAPRDDRQRAALAKMTEDLKAADRLFKLPQAAGCKPGRVAVVHPYQGAAPHGAASGKPQPEHAELQATWEFACANPAALDRMDVQLFDVFRGLKRIKAQTASPKGQGAATLTPARRTVAL
jgi:hypothetical protein